jgi:hypothetical protein
MELILSYIQNYKETFIKENSERIRNLDNFIKRLKVQPKTFDGVRILINEKPYEYSISHKSGKIKRNSLCVYTNYHLNGILLFYSMLGSIAFLTEDFVLNCTLQRVFTLLLGDVKSAQELLIYLNDKSNNIDPLFFAEYLYYMHNVLLINRKNFIGITHNIVTNKYQKEYVSNDELIVNFINELSKIKVETKIIVCKLNSKFYDDINDDLISLTKVYLGNIISPVSMNIDQKDYYDTWYLLNDDKIRIKSNKVIFDDFLINV